MQNQSDESLYRYKNLLFVDDSWKVLAGYSLNEEMIAQTLTTPDKQDQIRKGIVFIRRFGEYEIDVITTLSEDRAIWNVRSVWGYYYYKEFVFPIHILTLMKLLHVTLDMVVTAIKHSDQRDAEPERGDMEPETTYHKKFKKGLLRVDALFDEDRLRIMVTGVQFLPCDTWWQQMQKAMGDWVFWRKGKRNLPHL